VTRTLILLAFLALPSAMGSLADAPLKWVTVDYLCGYLEFFTPIEGGGNDSKPLKNVLLELYPWEQGIFCCKNSHPFFKTTTGKDGRYEFKNIDAGRYWLVAHWRRKTFQLPVVFNSENASSQNCEVQGLDIDSSGDFQSWIKSQQ